MDINEGYYLGYISFPDDETIRLDVPGVGFHDSRSTNDDWAKRKIIKYLAVCGFKSAKTVDRIQLLRTIAENNYSKIPTKVICYCGATGSKIDIHDFESLETAK